MSSLCRYKSSASDARKKALVRNACLALKVHAQLEEEIFYPALRTIAGPDNALEKSVPEHDQIRTLISRLKQMSPQNADYDATFFELMRTVMHHVADEEATLLPEAERTMGEKLNELGTQMTKRRMQLMAPHAGEVAATTLQTFPVMSAMSAASALLLGSMLLKRNHQAPRLRR